MGMTAIEKALASRGGCASVRPGDVVEPAPDAIMIHDNVVIGAKQELDSIGIDRIATPEKVIMVSDHEVLYGSLGAARMGAFNRAAAAQWGVEQFYDVGRGGHGHLFPIERGIVVPGMMYFDNDRHVLGAEHVLASTALPGMPPTVIDNQRYGGSAVSVAALDDARPADTLCFVIDGYDPVPGKGGGASRSVREIAALRRNHDLRRMIALLGERVPLGLRGDTDIRKCLAEASEATMTILHLVHEGSADHLTEKTADFSSESISRRWHAGENDVATSLAHPMWLAPPPRRLGVVVHEMRGGVAAPPR